MIQVNLLPWREQKQQKLFKRMTLIFIICLVANAALISAATTKINAINQMHHQMLLQKKRQNESLLLDINRIEAEQKAFNLISERLSQIVDLKQQTEKRVNLLVLILHWLPEQAWLTKVSIHQHSLLIEGSALNYPSIVSFSTHARHSAAIKNVDVVEVSHQKPQQASLFAHLNFKLEALWQ